MGVMIGHGREGFMKIAIAGAGIGGLSAALALHAKGFQVQVFELVDELRPLGVGINVMPHAARILHHWGLGERMDAMAIRTRCIEYRTKFGHLIQSDPRSVEAGFDYPQYSVHRGQLQFMLLQAVRERLGEDSVIVGNGVVGFTQSADHVTVHLADGERYDAALLLGADGFRSKVRAGLHPTEGPAHYEGTMMWRGANLQERFADGRTMFIAGDHDVKFVCYPISAQADAQGKSLVNWVAEVRHDQPRAADVADWTAEGGRDFIRHFDDFQMGDIDVADLLRQTAQITQYPMIDRDPLPYWGIHRVSLLGDAAHPMYPIGANGASQAILDSEALAEAVAQYAMTPMALQAYEDLRRPATTQVVLTNRQSGPEAVLDIAAARVKGPDDRIEDLISPEELEEVAANYRKIAGFMKKAG